MGHSASTARGSPGRIQPNAQSTVTLSRAALEDGELLIIDAGNETLGDPTGVGRHSLGRPGDADTPDRRQDRPRQHGVGWQLDVSATRAVTSVPRRRLRFD